jgi:ribosome-binding protein aMBF1 (putative translation factor)
VKCLKVTCSHFGSKFFCWQNESVTKTVHSALARIFCDHLRALREKAGMTQRDLAAAIGREHGMIARIELGERRVDLAEAFQIFTALGAAPDKEAAAVMVKYSRAAAKLL